MTRLQKKCFTFSLGLHGLLAVILLASAGFGTRPERANLQILTMIPANIVDRAGAGGGAAIVTPAPQPQPPAPQPQPPAQPVRSEPVERVPRPTPRQQEELPRPEPMPRQNDDLSLEPKPKGHKPSHEIHVSYVTANSVTKPKSKQRNPSEYSEASIARAEALRQRAIRNSLEGLASSVQNSGSQTPSVDVSGIGGGEAFAGYRDVVISAYYHAWTTPDSVANRQAVVEAKVTISRDGVVVHTEITRASGERALDKSVERALRDVTKLPPFPAGAKEQERTFTLQFSPEVKEMSG